MISLNGSNREGFSDTFLTCGKVIFLPDYALLFAPLLIPCTVLMMFLGYLDKLERHFSYGLFSPAVLKYVLAVVNRVE